MNFILDSEFSCFQQFLPKTIILYSDYNIKEEGSEVSNIFKDLKISNLNWKYPSLFPTIITKISMS